MEIDDSLQESDQNPDPYSQLVQNTIKKTGNITKDDFTMISVIGTGAYGKVLLVKKKGSDQLYAMKILKKK